MSLLLLPLPLPNNTPTSGGIISNTEKTHVVSQEITINDNVITLNTGEIGPGVTRSYAVSGFEVDRGPHQEKYQVLYNEASAGLEAGFEGQLEPVALIDSSVTAGTIPAWNGVNLTSYAGLNASQVNLLRSINQNLSSTSGPTFTTLNLISNSISLADQVFHFPNATTTPGSILSTDGYGNLFWTTLSSGGVGAPQSIQAQHGETSVVCDATSAYVSFAGQGAPKLQITNNTTTINNSLKVNGSISGSCKTISTSTYTIAANDYLLVWLNSGICSITLPAAASNAGRQLIIINKSNSGGITLTPSSSDLLEGDTQSLTITDNNDYLELICDGIDNWLIL
jgi:hypothetical protein